MPLTEASLSIGSEDHQPLSRQVGSGEACYTDRRNPTDQIFGSVILLL